MITWRDCLSFREKQKDLSDLLFKSKSDSYLTQLFLRPDNFIR